MMLKYNFGEPTYVGTEYLGFQIYDLENNIIGAAEGAGNKNGEFISVIKIYDSKFYKCGIGFLAFKRAFDLINSDFPISIIKTSWNKDGEFKDYENGMSTNLLIFLRNVEEMGETQSAISTPTGKWCLKLGYTVCKVIKNTSECVEAIFTKPKQQLTAGK